MNETIRNYLMDHGISESDAEFFGLKISENKISIPVRGKDGEPMFWKHRHFEGDIKYTYDKGATVSLFGADQIELFDFKIPIYICEGEMDCMAMRASGRQAVSSTGGAGSWKQEWNQLFEKFECIRVLYDRDKAGFEGSYRVWNSFQESGKAISIGVIPEDSGKDIAEYFVMSERNFRMFTVDIKPIQFITLGNSMANKGKSARCTAIRTILKQIEAYEKGESKSTIWPMLQILKRNIVEDIRFLSKPKPKPMNGADVQNIKSVPITNFVRFSGGVAQCVFHKDKNPSMHYNGIGTKFPNTVKCYSCGTFGDVIDVVMAINNCKFKEAVDIIRGNNT